MKKRNIILIVLLLCIIGISFYLLIIHNGKPRKDYLQKQEPAQSEGKFKEKPFMPETRPGQKKSKPDDKTKQNYAQNNIQKEYLRTIVYYFHSTARDATCRTIERLTSQSLYTYFRNQLASGKLIWKSVNMEDPWNRHFVDDFNLKQRSVVVVVPSANRQIRWKVLENTENLANDRTRFMKYIQNEVSPYLWGK